MGHDRWQQIKTTLAATLERRGRGRTTYLDGVRATDPELAREVEELLEHDSPDSFLEHPAVAQRASGLAPGTRIGQYEIGGELGAGGMGEVYRARDTKLDRDVTLKILPEAFVTDRERLARFRREARLLAALNHPNIAAIYGLEDSGERHALVLELVEGPTLGELLAQRQRPSLGAGLPAVGKSQRDGVSSHEPGGESPRPGGRSRGLPLDEALPIARQIAEALEAAHEQGIIHRDLKPANIKVKEDGTVKVLDFGLAKALGGEGASAVEDSPTITAMATQAGVIMGTAPYMSPEQAKGKTIDKRTEIWAFGCVLFEMLTGKPAFGARRWPKRSRPC